MVAMKKQSLSSRKQAEQLCRWLRLFYAKGWVTGTGGGICTAIGPEAVLMAPTGVHKEEVTPPDLFVVRRRDGTILRPPRNRSLAVSECNPIFCTVMNLRGAGSVMHSHALSAVLAADLAGARDSLVIEELEMLKGIRGVSNQAKHAVPVIPNTVRERELTVQVCRVLEDPAGAESFCILVRNHGAYIWGADLWETKRHAEIYHFLFDAVNARQDRLRNSRER
jgi:methylthioribulose-1-phosphate dehydratase